MNILGVEIPNELVDAGTIAALIGIPYLIFANRSKRSRFDFKFRSSQGNYNSTTDTFTWSTEGVIRNRSNADNTIVEVCRVIWKNNKRNSYLIGSSANITINDLKTNKIVHLPMYFKGRQARKLLVSTSFSVKGSSDEKVLSQLKEIRPGSNIFIPKYNYELYFEDIDRNFFDEKGNLINKDEADLWWTLPNSFNALNDGNVKPYIKHSFFIMVSKAKFFIRKLFWNIGL